MDTGTAASDSTDTQDTERRIAAIQAPGHPLHKAWAELSKTGYRRGWFANANDVRTLLEGIRSDFPDVENRFDPQRVGAWDAKLYPGSTEAGGFQSAISDKRFIAVLAIFALRFGIMPLLHNGGTFFGSVRVPTSIPGGSSSAAATPAGPDPATVALDRAAAHWFGNGTDLAALGRMAPLVAQRASAGAGGTMDFDSADHAMRDAVFAGLALALPQADHGTLHAVQQVRLQAIDAAAKIDAPTCSDVMTRSLLDNKVTLTPATQTRAAALIRQIAATGIYGRDLRPSPRTANVPGPVIGHVMASTGLSADQVHNALRQIGPDGVQCSVHRALMRETLRLPGNEGDALLRIE